MEVEIENRLNTSLLNRDWETVSEIIIYNIKNIDKIEAKNIISSTPLVLQLIRKVYDAYNILLHNHREELSKYDNLKFEKLSELLKEVKNERERAIN